MARTKVRYEIDLLVSGVYIVRCIEKTRGFPFNKTVSYILYEGESKQEAERAIAKDIKERTPNKVVRRDYYNSLGNPTGSPY